MSEALNTARQCRHYAMCKIDYLGGGLCPGARDRYFVSFYPQGIMDIYADAAQGRIPVTPGMVDVAEACTLCGKCDLQCHFVTELRPTKAARGLKELVREHLATRDPVEAPADPVLEELRAIVGPGWATNDPAHLSAYSDDPCPISTKTLPKYVVLPGSTDEVAETVELCRRRGLEFTVRGNGSSVMGFVLSSGVVMDMARLRRMEFDEANWCVHVGAGISSYELQREAFGRGFLVNTAEPAALYCSNIICSGIFSLFSSALGTGADNVVDAEFVSWEGRHFHLSDREAPNHFAFVRRDMRAPGICTAATVRLHPLTGDESGIAVPFGDFDEALEYSRDLGRRGLGLGIGMLGVEYTATFMAPTTELARGMRRVLPQKLGIDYLVVVLGDPASLKAASELAPAVMDADMMRCLMLGMNSLTEDGVAEILEGLEGEDLPCRLLARPGMLPVLEAVLDPSPGNLAASVDEDMRDLYTDIYGRPEMTDLFLMNVFRTVSSRMGREGHVVAFIVYVPLEDPRAVWELHRAFEDVAGRFGVRGDLGFITPIDRGRMGVLEWDMYLDHTDEEEADRMRGAMAAAGKMLEEFSSGDPRFLWIRYLFNQGFCRKESFLYYQAQGK